jgi:hypothetical protein
MKTKFRLAGLLACGVFVVAAPVRAQDADSEVRATPPEDTSAAVRDGIVVPFTLAAKVGSVPAFATAFGGYDGARSAPIMTATAEARIWGPIALRGGAEYSDVRKGMRPTVGLRAQVLRQERHGVDGAISVFYRPEGFTEPEGEIETFISLGRRIDRVTLLGNLVYGQDPEGNERDGELRFSSLYAAGRWAFGVDSRARFALGPQKTAMAQSEPKLDFMAGPLAAATVGPVALYAEAGPSLLKLAGSTTAAGFAGLGGVAAVF